MKSSKKQPKARSSKTEGKKKRETYEILLGFFLFIYPLFYTPFLKDQFESPRIFLAFLVVPLAWIFFLLRKEKIIFDSVSIFALAFACSYVLISLIGRYSGTFTLSDVFGSFDFPMSPLFVLASALLLVLIRQVKESSFLLRSFLYSSGLSGLVAVVQFLFFRNSSVFEGRSFLPAGNPVFLGGFLAISFALLLTSKVGTSEKTVLFALILAGIAVSGTRTAIFAVFLSLLLYILLSKEKGKSRAVLLSFPFLAFFVFLNLGRIMEVLKEFSRRTDLYMASVRGFFENPILGNGFSGYERFFRKLSISKYYLNNFREVPNSSHSVLLDVLFGGGIVPFLLLLGLLASVLIENAVFGLASLSVLLFTPPQPYIWFAFAAGSGLVARRLRVWKLRINRPLKYLVLIVAMVSFVVSTYSTYEVLAANYYYQQFFESMHSGNLTQASEILEKAISLLPKENRFLIEKAVFYSKVYGIGAGDVNYVKTALEALEKAQENNPYSFEVALLKSDVLLQMGDLGEKPSYENALSTAKVAIYLSPYDAKGYYQLGLAYAGLNQIDRAIAAWQKAVSLKSDYAEAYYSLGYAYEVKNDIKSALKFYNLARRFASEQDKAVIEESIQRLKSKQK